MFNTGDLGQLSVLVSMIPLPNSNNLNVHKGQSHQLFSG